MIGQTLGPYYIHSLIGQGGMGFVFSGEHQSIGRKVALKVLRPELSLRDDIAERFIQEARAVNTIGHKHIVKIYDFGRTPFGSFYIVMEYLPGQTLRNYLKQQGPLPLPLVKMVVNQVGAALCAAHGKEFVHRDVKPENIILNQQQGQYQIKLVDFGIAKLLTAPAKQTSTGITPLGTPQYMSPEQLEGCEYDHRTDVFSLGVVTYEMITGCIPFPGKNQTDVRMQQLKQTPPPPSVLRPEVTISRKLDSAVLWALSSDVSARCKSIEAFITAVNSGLVDTYVPHVPSFLDVSVPFVAKRKKNVGLWIGLGSLVILVFVAVAYLRPWKSGSFQSNRSTLSKTQGAPLSDPPMESTSTHRLAEKIVQSALSSTDKDHKLQALTYLGSRSRPVMVDAIIFALKDPNPGIRRAAAQALGKLKVKKATVQLKAALQNNIGFTAWDIAGALAQLGDPSGVTFLRQEIQRFKHSRDDFKKMYILHILGKLGDKSARAWSKILRDAHRIITPSLRRKALGYLARIGDAKAKHELYQIINNDNWDSRVEAAESIMPINPRLARRTFRLALHKAQGHTRFLAAKELSRFGDSKALEVLVKFLQAPDIDIKRQSALALEVYKSKDAQKALEHVLSRDPRIALAVAVALLP